MFNDLVDADPLDAHRALLDVVPSADMTYMGAMLPDTFVPELSNAGHPRSVPPTLRSRVAGALIAPYG
jgi:hypothetical protein